MYVLMMAFVIFAGSMMPIQAGINSSLAKYLNHPVHAAVVSFAGGFLAMLAAALIIGKPAPSIFVLSKVPWPFFIGGFLGTIVVVTSIILAPKLGATILIACLIAGQLFMSIILDHNGWIGFPVHSITLGRIIGLICLAGGVILVRIF
jgi:transporter family-2 protein